MAGEIDESPYTTWATERERRAEIKGATDERARIRREQAAVIYWLRTQHLYSEAARLEEATRDD